MAACCRLPVWNVLTARDRGTGIKDYDLIYFDNDDLSWTAEDRVIRSVATATRECVGPIEVRNQARVHLWFESRFGTAYDRLSSAMKRCTATPRSFTPSAFGSRTMIGSIRWRRLVSMIFFLW
jgi:hypothetical protein